MLVAFSIVALVISMVALCGVSLLIGLRKGERAASYNAQERKLESIFDGLGDMVGKMSSFSTVLSALPSTPIVVGQAVRERVRPSPKVCRKHNSPTCTTCDSDEDYK